MALQLIYTSSLQLLDSDASGYGVVARSEKLSRALCTRLSAISAYREPRAGACSTGPQYSYRIIDHAGTAWHVLTCAQSAGADYSGRGCFIAHHLIFEQEEVRALLASNLRPTPAGITMALEKTGFWLSKWKGAPAFIAGSPDIDLSAMPDASSQPEWKRITGHKANARAFFTPPFSKECLITLPPRVSSSDLLRLFHESDWLTHTRGWGVSYTTVADEADNFAETLRMAVPEGSPLVQRAVRTGHPVLKIEADMELPLPEPAREAPASDPVKPSPRRPEDATLTRTLSRTVSHYHYTEESDWIMYDIKPSVRVVTPRNLLIAGAAAGVCLAAWFFWDNAVPADLQPEHMVESVPDAGDSPVPFIQQLTEVINADYDHAAVQLFLVDLTAIPEKSPEDSLLLESAVLIQNASQAGARHPSAIKRLCECARLLGVDVTGMVRLYLREATHHVSPEDWQKQYDGQMLSDWLTLKQAEPQIIELLHSGEFQAYAPLPAADEPETTILATANPSEPENGEETNGEAAPPGRISLIPATAVSGSPLPKELESIIPRLPLSITTGSYVVSGFAKGGELAAARRLDLSADGYHLYITPTGNAGEIMLKPEHREGKPAPVPAATFSVRGGRLQNIHSEGSEAVICFPVPSQENFHTNVVLASSFGIPIPKGKGISLPPAARTNLLVTPDDLEIVSSSIGAPAPQIRLRKKKEFPWVLTRQEKERIKFSVSLPVLNGHNAMQLVGDDLDTFVWKGADIVKETDARSTVRCEVEHVPDLPGRLLRAFDRVMNTPCCGETDSKNKSVTLGKLYYICCALANEKISRSERRQLEQDYFALFAHKQFNKILTRVLAQDAALCLTPEEASSNKFKALKVRNNIRKQLGTRAIRDLIRRRICEVVTRTMHAAYTQEQQLLEDKQGNSPVLILDDISYGQHVELLWKFRMQQGSR